MSESKDKVRNGLSLGVLIIGSLRWDRASHRKKWRCDRLDQSRCKYVRAPIRYGRQSKSRGCSYTMVFSKSLSEDEYGRAIVVPCCRPAKDIGSVVDEAEHLWTAETSKCKNSEHRVSAGWGCVGLLSKHPLPADWCSGWKKKISGEPCYGRLKHADNEDPAVDGSSGFLTIPWPKSEDGSGLEVDILLATATCPTICNGRYPTAQEIAAAWNSQRGRDHVDYFRKNRAHGIKTFQDDCIQEHLRALWQQ